MDCEAIRDELDAYALGALDPAEREVIARHLAGCADCRALADELADATAALPLALAAASPHRPPAALRARLLAAAAGKPAADGAEATARGPWPAGTRAGAIGSGWRRRGVAGTLGRLAAVLVLILALGWSVHLGFALEQERALRVELAQLVGQQEIVLEVVDSDRTVRRVLLTTRPDACQPGTCPYGKLFTRSDLVHVVAMAARLPPPPAGQAYLLWLTTGGVTTAGGVFAVDANGFGLLVFDAPAPGPVYDEAVVTLQPLGATSPGGQSVLHWSAGGP